VSEALTDGSAPQGKQFPLGATWSDGVNFSVYSKNGTAVELLLFDHADDADPTNSIQLNPLTNALITTGTM
jgi:isoamylase